jgi:shikimate dehydrogenase
VTPPGTRRAAVLGSPIAHSLSPVLHRAAYAELGLDWSYAAHDVDEAGLPAFLAGLGPEWAGLSLTMPLKRAALDLADWCSATARTVEAINTLVFTPRGRLGANTDVPGMVAALAERRIRSAGSVSILGGGGTAAAALAAAAQLHAHAPELVVRRPHATGDLARVATRLGHRLVVRPWAEAADALGADLVVQTAPAGAADALAAAVPNSPGVLFDVLYDPWPTPLATAWAAAGGVVVGGLDLLVHQAVRQVELMTGRDVGIARLVPVMRAAGERALAERGSSSDTGHRPMH